MGDRSLRKTSEPDEKKTNGEVSEGVSYTVFGWGGSSLRKSRKERAATNKPKKSIGRANKKDDERKTRATGGQHQKKRRVQRANFGRIGEREVAPSGLGKTIAPLRSEKAV